jgi:hypothetical protein
LQWKLPGTVRAEGVPQIQDRQFSQTTQQAQTFSDKFHRPRSKGNISRRLHKFIQHLAPDVFKSGHGAQRARTKARAQLNKRKH